MCVKSPSAEPEAPPWTEERPEKLPEFQALLSLGTIKLASAWPVLWS